MSDLSSQPDEDRDAASSAAFSTGDAGLLADAGPAFDPDASGDELPALPDATAGGDLWQVSRVRAVLTAKGELLHGALAVDTDSTEWRYTQADLSAIAPALTRILNRYEPTRAAAAAGDELTVAVGFAGYAMRSWSERRRALAEYAADEPEPGQVAVPVIDNRPEPDAAMFDGQAADDDAPPPVPPLRGRGW